MRLYVGADDSNHAGISKPAKGEVIAAIFSFFEQDAVVKRHPYRRKYEETILGIRDRDYRFCLLVGEQYGRNSTNLPLAVPLLVSDYLKSLGDEEKERITSLDVFLDGRIPRILKHSVKIAIPEISMQNIRVEAFEKKKRLGKGKCSKRHFCPELVWRADTLANYLFREPLERLLSNSHILT